jgi:uncharacterized protein YeaO (DUF488 family)
VSALQRLRIKRVYDQPAESDGTRILVDRVWPRGLTKQRAAVDIWFKDIAPSAALRKWFGHVPERWDEFRGRYMAELRANPEAVDRLVEFTTSRPVTLLFGAHDSERNNAVALAKYLENRASGGPDPDLGGGITSTAPRRKKRNDQ